MVWAIDGLILLSLFIQVTEIPLFTYKPLIFRNISDPPEEHTACRKGKRKGNNFHSLGFFLGVFYGKANRNNLLCMCPAPSVYEYSFLYLLYLNNNEVIFTHIFSTIASPAHHSSIWYRPRPGHSPRFDPRKLSEPMKLNWSTEVFLTLTFSLNARLNIEFS